jgi:flagellar biosynthesis protein FlhF
VFTRLKLRVQRSAAVLEEAPQADLFRSASPVSVETPALPKIPAPRLKSYLVAEVRQAMSAARRELGDNAILIHTKRLDPPQVNAKYEVTFGVAGERPEFTPAPNVPSFPSADAPAAGGSSSKRRDDKVWADEFARVRADLAALHALLLKQEREFVSGRKSTPDTLKLQNQLIQHGVNPDLVSEWLGALDDSIATRGSLIDSEPCAQMLIDHLGSRIRVDPSLGWDSSQGKAIMFVGPSGAGKTTALLKTALEYGVKKGRPLELWTLDSKGDEFDPSVQSFARLLNTPTSTFRSAGTLAAAILATDLENRLVLIDTKGFGDQGVEPDHELSIVLGSSQLVDCQLVLPATWHASALSRAVDRFELFQPSRLLFTMLDQAQMWGPMLQEPWRTRKALSFVSEGALGAGTIQPASLARILDSIDESEL